MKRIVVRADLGTQAGYGGITRLETLAGSASIAKMAIDSVYLTPMGNNTSREICEKVRLH